MRIAGLIIGIMSLCAVSCKRNNVPADIIQPDEMGKILFDISMAEEFVNSYITKDSSRNKEAEIQREYQKVFMLYKVTEAGFRKSYAYYNSHPLIFKTLMDSLNARGQRARNKLYRNQVE